ncbi:putative nuclease HARBI1 [Heterodontus francisci]|uniref:putative nuclease HARBI1 n=1 Tax=Heterodontus francisci TaxID=7792 RepID=UPI00355B503E
MSECQCQRQLQVSREAVIHLCALLNDDMQLMGFGGHPMPAVLKVTAALNFYASASFQGPSGNLCGFKQSALHHCIREVTDALYQRASDYVRFRKDPESQAIGFDSIAGFPHVQGSLHLCGLHPCGHQGSRRATSCIPQPKGLSLAQSTAMRNLTSDAEERYNASHGRPRATNEQAISMLKTCFRCLDRSGGALQYELERVARIVAVCCALHNLILNRRQALQDEERREQDSSSDNEVAEGLQQEMCM